jgi:hypothetical protein
MGAFSVPLEGRQRRPALALNTTLTLIFHGDNALAGEIQRLVAVNRALDAKLLAVMMSMHARLGAESGLKVLEDHPVTLICDLFCRESKASSPLGKASVFVCPGNHHLETGAVTDETPLVQASCNVCLKTLQVGTQVLSCRACDWYGCRDCRAEAKR